MPVNNTNSVKITNCQLHGGVVQLSTFGKTVYNSVSQSFSQLASHSNQQEPCVWMNARTSLHFRTNTHTRNQEGEVYEWKITTMAKKCKRLQTTSTKIDEDELSTHFGRRVHFSMTIKCQKEQKSTQTDSSYAWTRRWD